MHAAGVKTYFINPAQDEEQITFANFLYALRGENILIRFNQESFVSEINFLFVTLLPTSILMMKEIKFYCINQQNHRRQIAQQFSYAKILASAKPVWNRFAGKIVLSNFNEEAIWW